MASGFVGTSLGILLSQVCVTAHVRESKVVHALLSAYWAYWSGWGQGVIGGYEEAKKSLKEAGVPVSLSFIQNRFK